MNEYIGIDIGGTKTAIVRGDENGTILEKKRFATTTKGETLEMIFQTKWHCAVKDCLAGNTFVSDHRIVGCLLCMIQRMASYTWDKDGVDVSLITGIQSP